MLDVGDPGRGPSGGSGPPRGLQAPFPDEGVVETRVLNLWPLPPGPASRLTWEFTNSQGCSGETVSTVGGVPTSMWRS